MGNTETNDKPNSRPRRFNGWNAEPKSAVKALAEYAGQKNRNANRAVAASAAPMPRSQVPRTRRTPAAMPSARQKLALIQIEAIEAGNLIENKTGLYGESLFV